MYDVVQALLVLNEHMPSGSEAVQRPLQAVYLVDGGCMENEEDI